jgi:hypothetical protein
MGDVRQLSLVALLGLAACGTLLGLDSVGDGDAAEGGGATNTTSASGAGGTGVTSTTNGGGGGASSVGGAGGAGGLDCANVDCSNYAAMVACHGAIHHWPLDEQTGTDAADVIGGLTATVAGAADLGVSGVFGTGAAFNGGLAQYIEVPHDASLDFPDAEPFSIELWVSTPDVNQGSPASTLLSHMNGATSRDGWAVRLADQSAGATLSFEVWRDGGSVVATEPTPVTVNSWHHVVAVRTPTSVRIFVNGKLDPTGTTFALETVTESLLIGCNRNTAGSPQHCFNGTIDEVAIYDFDLQDAAIEAHYACAPGN